jgi:glutamate-1-semialdehyde 2,1-aminomutase
MTGFRVAWGGYQALTPVRPDLTCLGKIIGGGLPAAAYGGRRDLMEQVAPSGAVYQAGTLSGNPLAVAAGLKTLELLEEPGVYEQLEAKGSHLQLALEEAIQAAGAPARIQRVGSMLTLFFHPEPVQGWRDADQCNREAFARFHHAMLEGGIFLPPAQFEAWFISTTHTPDDLDQTAEVAKAALTQALGG